MRGPIQVALNYLAAVIALETADDDVSGRLTAEASAELDVLQEGLEDATQAVLRQVINTRRAVIKRAIVRELEAEGSITDQWASRTAEHILNAVYQA